MSIKTVLQKAATTAFKVFKSLIQHVTYVKVSDDGFGTTVTSTYPVDMIVTGTSGVSPTSVSFYSKIQAEDKIGMLKGSSVVGFVVAIEDRVIAEDGSKYDVKAYDVDAAKALYIFLLRGVKS